MQGSWVSSPNLSNGPMPLPGYDNMGNSIGVPLRYYDKHANEISPSVFSKTNRDITIKLETPSNNEFLTMKKRKDDFSNNFKMPEPFVLKVEKFVPIEINPAPLIKVKPFEFIKIEPTPLIKVKPFEPIIINAPPLIDFNEFKPKKKSSYDPFGMNNF
jgi:hypothetical protein